jgi:hypothetical protein
VTFIVSEDRRVFDPDRELGLFYEGGSTDGIHQFALRGPAIEVSFLARRKVARIEGADPELPPQLRTLVTWKVDNLIPPRGWGREQFKQVVREALTACKFAHGGPEGQLVEVLFMNKFSGE